MIVTDLRDASMKVVTCFDCGSVPVRCLQLVADDTCIFAGLENGELMLFPLNLKST